jgi:ABC-type polysaccharide/polyol phosphate export permease
MAGIIISYRQVVLEGVNPDIQFLGISAGISTLLAFIAYIYFKRLEMAMSDII